MELVRGSSMVRMTSSWGQWSIAVRLGVSGTCIGGSCRGGLQWVLPQASLQDSGSSGCSVRLCDGGSL